MAGLTPLLQTYGAFEAGRTPARIRLPDAAPSDKAAAMADFGGRCGLGGNKSDAGRVQDGRTVCGLTVDSIANDLRAGML